MTTPESLEALVRPLAERRVVPECSCGGAYAKRGMPRFSVLCPRCDGPKPYPLDVRFAALREKACEYAYLDGPHPADCPWCFFKARTDLGSLVRCAAACGWGVDILEDNGLWEATVYAETSLGDYYMVFPSKEALVGEGASPEDALARALVAAVGAEEAK